MNPFLQNAMGSTAAQMQNVNQQEQQKLLGSEIQQGAFGGDRGKVAQAALMNQQNLALGQTLGGMASQGFQNAAQNYQTGLGQIGALGVQGQQAGLQGAQAMLGAGTLGQQTTQAGQSALYNQFQQQQAYPFQVAQFLANIAEGTGALSGSTTTTTAPQSFFSDARLKEDIKQVGTAKNGLPIYTFKYKGDDAEQTHIGYMAQDVEKVHPEAVGESHGYKTVDYDKASEPVHRASGGAANSEGGVVAPEHTREGYFDGGDVVSPYDISAILASQQQSYAPFTKGGIYGGSSASTPGGKGIVPAGNLPVAHLGVANPARAQQNETLMGDVQGAMNVGDTIKKANEYRKDIVGQPAQPAKAAIPASAGKAAQAAVDAKPSTGIYGLGDLLKTLGQPQSEAHGGAIGYAAGGGVEPYQTDDPMSQVVSDTEKDKNQHGLMTAQNPTGQPSSTMGDLGKIVSAGETAATIGSGISSALPFILAPFGLATGGVADREHHADGEKVGEAPAGGVVANAAPDPADDFVNNYWSKHVKQESGGKQFNADGTPLTSSKGAVGVGQIMPSTGPEAAKLAGVEWSPEKLASDPEYNQTLGKAYLKAQYQKYQDPALASAAYNAGPGNVDLALEKASTKGGSYLSYLPTETQKYVSSIYGGPKPADNGILGTLGNMFGAGPAQAQEAPKSNQKSLGDTLSSEQFLIPLLSGLGTMAGSNSRYLGAAILQGLGGGAKTYADLQTQQAGLKQTEAETAAKKAETARNRVFSVGNQLFINAQYPNGAEGNIMSAYDWLYGDPATRPALTPEQEGQVREFAAKHPSGAGVQPPKSDIVPPTANKPDQSITEQPLAPLAGDKAASNVAGPTRVIGDTTTAPELAKGETSISLSPDAVALAKNNLEQARVAQDASGDVFSGQAALGRAARDQRNTLLPLAGSFSRIPSTGPTSGGQLQAVLSPVMDTMNHLGAVLGAPNLIKDPSILTDQKEVDKLITQLQAQATSDAGQHAYAALKTLSGALPSNLMDKNSQARLMSRLMATNQKEIDRDNYFNQFYNTVAATPGGAAFAKFSGKGLDQQFEKDYGPNTISTDAANLERMFKAGVKEKNGRNLMDVLTSGEPLTKAQKASIRQNFGNKTLRYFGIDE